jgi:hypothetical protein
VCDPFKSTGVSPRPPDKSARCNYVDPSAHHRLQQGLEAAYTALSQPELASAAKNAKECGATSAPA